MTSDNQAEKIAKILWEKYKGFLIIWILWATGIFLVMSENAKLKIQVKTLILEADDCHKQIQTALNPPPTYDSRTLKRLSPYFAGQSVCNSDTGFYEISTGTKAGDWLSTNYECLRNGQ